MFQQRTAKAFAAEHANNLPHLWHHACATDACMNSGAEVVFDAASARMNCAASADQRPPFFAARTTSLARLPSPTSSGYVTSFRGASVFRLRAQLTPTWCHRPTGIHGTS